MRTANGSEPSRTVRKGFAMKGRRQRSTKALSHQEDQHQLRPAFSGEFGDEAAARHRDDPEAPFEQTDSHRKYNE